MAPRTRAPDPRQGDLFGAPLPPVPTVAPAASAQAVPPVEAPDAETRARWEAVRVERNAAFMAGAGAGKTHNLITMCLHGLGGVRASGPAVAPRELWLLTFSEKAAAEMRQRLRQRIDGLAEGTGAPERELQFNSAALNQPLPPREFWNGVREQLGAATIKTFHSACLQILNEAPGAEPVELLEERDAAKLLHDIATAAVLEALERKSPGVELMLRGRGLAGVVAALGQTLNQLREEGLTPHTLAVTTDAEARQGFTEALQLTRQLFREASTAKLPPKEAERLQQLADPLRRLTLENEAQVWPEVAAAIKGARAAPMRPLIEQIRGTETESSAPRLVNALGTWRMLPCEQAVRELLVVMAARFDAAMHERRCLDFTGQLVRCRDLLRDHLHVRAMLQRRIRLLLVDEFQDTNRLQMEILSLLAESRTDSPRAITSSLDGSSEEIATLPLQPGLLAIVGDVKQAIYDFRGADVGVFRRMAERIVAGGGVLVRLSQSRRTTAPLVHQLNSLSAATMASSQFPTPARDFEIAFTDGDALDAHRKEAPAGPSLLTLNLGLDPDQKLTAAELAAQEADALARWLATVFAEQSLTVCDSAGAERPARPGDVALLFRTLTQLNVYRQALLRHDIRHRLAMKRGFASAMEIADIASLLQLIAMPTDVVSHAAVLRSPLVGLSDDALTRLTMRAPKLDWHALNLDTIELRPLERDGLTALRETVTALRALGDRLSVSEVLEQCVTRLAIRERYAGLPFGEQALGNINRLREFAARATTQSLAAFSAELLARADQAIDDTAEADLASGSDDSLVTLSTVHGAKGLEWPIVVLPYLFAPPRSSGLTIRFERSMGMAVMFANDRVPKEVAPRRFEALKKLKNRREHAESLRLLYVAMTRARDRLVLGVAQGHARSWGDLLTGALGTVAVQGQRYAQLDADALPTRVRRAAPVEATVSTAGLLGPRAPETPPLAQTVMLPVTQLQEFDACPRRAHFGITLGLPETPVEIDWVDHEERPSAGDPRARGVMAHTLLELMPLASARRGDFAAAMQSIRAQQGLDADAEVDTWVTRFWRSAFGQRVCAEGTEVHREASFVLRLHTRDSVRLLLRGQIDLLMIENGHASLIDYKTTHSGPRGVAPYAFQLSAYALAARHLVPPGVQLHAGIVFLKDDTCEPQFITALTPEAEMEAQLTRLASEMMLAQTTQQWAGRPRAQCEAMRCGYVARCHGPTGLT